MDAVKMVPAICTQCGAKLDVDISKDAAICPYCRTPFVVEKAINKYKTEYHIEHADIHVESFGASVANTIKNYHDNKHKERMRELEAEAEKERKKLEAEAEKERRANEPMSLQESISFAVVGIPVLAIFIIIWIIIFRDISGQLKQEEEFKQLVQEIEVDLTNKDYDAARVKANKIHSTATNSDTVEKWDKVREDTLKLIDELQYGREGTEGNKAGEGG